MIASLLADLFHRRTLSDRALAVRNAASYESRLLALDTSDGWDAWFDSQRSASGEAVTHSSALTLASVWQATSLISGDVASMTLDCFRRLPGGDREIADDHPAELLVSSIANDETSAYELWRRCLAHALLWGNGYLWIERRGSRFGPPTALVNLLPDRTGPDRDDRGNLIYTTEVDGRIEVLFKEEVLHVKGLSVENGVGCDLVRKARDTIGLALAAQNYASKFFANGSQMGGILTVPATYTQKAADKLEEGWSKRNQDKNAWFKTVILRDGASWQSVTMDAQKAQQHELREDQVRDVARFFNLPGFKLNIKDSVSYNSSEQAQLAYLTGCLNHWRMAVSSECGMKLLTKEERKSHYFEHNPTILLEMDSKSLNEVLEIQRRNEIISANEWRRKLNLHKRSDPKGDEYENPNTKSAAGGEVVEEEVVPTAFLDVPNRRQSTPYSCGAAATWAVADYWNVGGDRVEADYIRELGTTPEGGTEPEAIIDWFNDAGLKVVSGQKLTTDDLQDFFAAGMPVIVPLQMYGITPEYDAEEIGNQSGHYVVVVGVALGCVLFMDPSADNAIGDEAGAPPNGLGVMPVAEFDRRWHDVEGDGVVDDHFGIAVGMMTPVLDDEAEPTEEMDPNAPPVEGDGVTPPAKSGTSAAKQGTVQDTALNGAQVTAFIAIVQAVATKQLPPETGKASLAASFPLMSAEQIAAAIDPLANFEPPKPEPPTIATPKGPPPDNATAALRDLFADAVNRVARRVCFDARTAAKKPGKFLAWLDGKAAEHRPVFHDVLRPVVNTVAAVQCRDLDAPDQWLTESADLFFGALLSSLSVLVEPPHAQSQLVENVDAACTEFEGKAAAALSAVVFRDETPATPEPEPTEVVVKAVRRDANDMVAEIVEKRYRKEAARA